MIVVCLVCLVKERLLPAPNILLGLTGGGAADLRGRGTSHFIARVWKEGTDSSTS